MQSPPLTITGSYNGSDNLITSLTSTAKVKLGMFANGNDVGGWVTSIDSNSQVALSNDSGSAGIADSILFYSAAAGSVPTRTLGLPDEYALDGYGRRMQYVVDLGATRADSCHDMQVTGGSGNIHIKDTAAAATDSDTVMWALMSYGHDGHGAFPANGGSMANRFDTGSGDADTANNAFAASGIMGTSTFSGTLVRKEKTTDANGKVLFDDKVWYAEPTKNTCCVGKMCNFGVRIDGAASDKLGYQGVATGDINGDGIADLIITTNNNKLYVIFGRKTNWPTPGTAFNLNNPINSPYKQGVIITNDSPASFPNWNVSIGNGGPGFAVGDVNGDGYDDIVMGSGNASGSKLTVYLGAANPLDANLSSLSPSITLPHTNWNLAPPVALVDVNGDGKKDVFALVDSAGLSTPEAYVWYGGSASINIASTPLCAATNGFKVATSNGVTTLAMENIGEMGDLNNDGYGDLAISGGNTKRVLSMLFGRAAATWASEEDVHCSVGPPIAHSTINANLHIGTVSKGSQLTWTSQMLGGNTIKVADLNGDGINDLLFDVGVSGAYNGAAIFLGQSTFSATSYDLSGSLPTVLTRIGLSTTKPSWVTASTLALGLTVGDINNDGKRDIIFSSATSTPNTIAGAGSSFAQIQPKAGFSSLGTSAVYNLFAHAFQAGDSGLPLSDDVKQGFRIDGAVASDALKVLAVADMDGDGKNDIILASPTRDSNKGSVYILWGKATVPWDESFDVSPLN